MREAPAVLLEAAQALAEYERTLESLAKVALPKGTPHQEVTYLKNEIERVRRLVVELGQIALRYTPSRAVTDWNRGNKKALEQIAHVSYTKPSNSA